MYFKKPFFRLSDQSELRSDGIGQTSILGVTTINNGQPDLDFGVKLATPYIELRIRGYVTSMQLHISVINNCNAC